MLEEPEEKRGFFSKIFGKDDANVEELDEADVSTEEIETTIVQISDDTPEAPDNSPSGTYERGLAFEFGEGVPQSYMTAFEFFKKSADLNHAPAQYKVGLAYAYGQGTEKDPAVAAEWYKKSASQGYALAQRTLATLYMSGEGIEQNKPLALAWYDILADSGNVMDAHRRDALKEKLTSDEIDEANKLKQELSN
jgi:TPR repeat protein